MIADVPPDRMKLCKWASEHWVERTPTSSQAARRASFGARDDASTLLAIPAHNCSQHGGYGSAVERREGAHDDGTHT